MGNYRQGVSRLAVHSETRSVNLLNEFAQMIKTYWSADFLEIFF